MSPSMIRTPVPPSGLTAVPYSEIVPLAVEMIVCCWCRMPSLFPVVPPVAVSRISPVAEVILPALSMPMKVPVSVPAVLASMVMSPASVSRLPVPAITTLRAASNVIALEPG